MNGTQIGWRSLVAFGISGGLVPCPSALVVMLSAIALGRAAYGLALVGAFSLGLAITLIGIGILFVYAGRSLQRLSAGTLPLRALPVASALVITCIGLAICYDGLIESGVGAWIEDGISSAIEPAVLETPGMEALS